MERQEIAAVVVSTLKTIAPELEESELAADEPLRDQVDLDSLLAPA